MCTFDTVLRVAQNWPTEMALYSLRESARFPFHAEPTHTEVIIHAVGVFRGSGGAGDIDEA
jgi:hypothetical protein